MKPFVYINDNKVPVVRIKNSKRKWELWFVRYDQERDRVVVWLERKGKELSIPRSWVE